MKWYVRHKSEISNLFLFRLIINNYIFEVKYLAMCPSRKVIGQSKNGVITYCSHNNLFQLVFNNLCFELYEWEFDVFKKHVLSLDAAYWEEQMHCAVNHRKIPLSVGTKHFVILLSKRELLELKTLLKTPQKKVALLGVKDIDYTFIVN